MEKCVLHSEVAPKYFEYALKVRRDYENNLYVCSVEKKMCGLKMQLNTRLIFFLKKAC